ncbi:hypothetical protein ACFYNO_24305 [Kitasatospora sp. NPDC006697]|uniref:hypothetical protein n=1 Tax=Kitasatospora sp. NPDC006697 TaxID=3364020 RepID=UPI0036C82E5D
MSIDIGPGALPLALGGTFQPWSIEAGHSKLLLRGFLGDPESEDPPRVFDVLFQDVSRISIGDYYDGLNITVATAEELAREEQRVGGNWRDSRLFRLSDRSICDYVVAGFLFWAEVGVRANDPSPLLLEAPAVGSIKGRLYRL